MSISIYPKLHSGLLISAMGVAGYYGLVVITDTSSFSFYILCLHSEVTSVFLTVVALMLAKFNVNAELLYLRY